MNVWGEADPGEAITVIGSWSEQAVETVAGDGGARAVQLETPSANTDGTTYTVTIQGDNTIALKNVAIGEVWIMSGQSNADVTTTGNVEGAEEAIAGARYDQIRAHRAVVRLPQR